MIYFVGGAPRVGKTVLGERLCTKLAVGWISTDVLADLLRMANAPGRTMPWDATPAAITAKAEWFFPYLERFIWGITSFTDQYVIEGVHFLPAQLAKLSTHYPLRAVFLGRSRMTLEDVTRVPGRSMGYVNLPETQRRQIVEGVPHWSAFIRQEAERLGFPYVDMADDFSGRLSEAETVLTAV